MEQFSQYSLAIASLALLTLLVLAPSPAAGVAGAILAAILAGVSVFRGSLFAVLAVLSRFAMVYVHISDIGKGELGPRSIINVFGCAMALLIALFGFVAALL